MHAIASTILAFFLSPINWLILLLVTYFVVNNAKVKLYTKWSALIIFLIFSNSWLLNSYAHWWDAEPVTLTNEKPYSCAILLGGFGSPDPNENGYFNSSSDRFIQTAKCYHQGKINHILISGGNGKTKVKSFNEGEWAKGELIAMGVPDSVIYHEDKSNNTKSNVENTKKLLQSKKLIPPYLLITSAYHIPRSELLFKSGGVDVIGFPSNYIAGKDQFAWGSFIPRTDILITWSYYLKETAGYCLYYIKEKW